MLVPPHPNRQSLEIPWGNDSAVIVGHIDAHQSYRVVKEFHENALLQMGGLCSVLRLARRKDFQDMYDGPVKSTALWPGNPANNIVPLVIDVILSGSCLQQYPFMSSRWYFRISSPYTSFIYPESPDCVTSRSRRGPIQLDSSFLSKCFSF